MGLEFEVIEDYKGNKVIYCGKCSKIFEYSNKMEKILDGYDRNNQQMEQKLLPYFSVAEIHTYKEIVEKYLEECEKNAENFCKVQCKKVQENRKYTTLWINISNDCNLRCIYCYGNGGSYNKDRALITMKKLVEILDFWLEHIDLKRKVLKVVFFGGEPLMNKEALKFVVNYLKSRISNETIILFEITTNGTILDDELLEIFSKNHFHITLSIDGGKEIQDFQRPFVNGKGSFLTLTKNLDAIRKKKIPVSARLTVTHKNISELLKCFQDIWSLGIANISFAPVSTENSDLRLTPQDMDILIKFIEQLGIFQYESIIQNKNIYVNNLFQFGKILHQNAMGICSFYVSDVLKVDINGDIFKCHRLIGVDDFFIGNVTQGLISENNKNIYSAVHNCPTCNYSNICIPCYEINYYANHDINIPDKEFCEFSKAIIKENIKLYVNLLRKLPEVAHKVYGKK